MSQLDKPLISTWLVWALLSAGFAALTAVFAKIGVETVEPNVATLIRTIVILTVLSGIVIATGQLRLITTATPRAYVFLVLSGLATGASWLCYFRAMHFGDASRVAPIDKLSVVLVAAFSVTFLGERLSATNWVGVALIAVGAWLVALR
jgi:transporter family protein